MIDNEEFRFGSAGFADAQAIARAGLYRQQPNSMFVGFFEGKPLWYSGAGGMLLTAGARGGKLRDILAYNLCFGIYTFSSIILDQKGELAALSQDQTPDGKFCFYWNAAALCGLPQHHINPVDYIRIDSPTLVSDVKVFCENMIALSGAANGVYFEQRAREFLEGIVLTVVRIDGVLTLPRLYHFINLIVSDSDGWLDFAFEMSESGFPISARVEEEIAASRKNPSNGFQGILGEIFKAFACLSDPLLMKSVSPPYDFSMAELCRSERAYQVYLMPPAEFVGPWAPVIKALLVAAMVYKSRAPQAPQQTWIIDECAQLGAFPLVPKLFTYGAGIGIRPWAVFQSAYQMNAMGPNAQNIITSSAALRSYFAVRDIESASAVSRMLGAQTLEYDDGHRQAEAELARREAMNALLNGEDPMSAGLRYAHYKKTSTMKTKQHRLLRTPDEILNMPPNRQFVFVDGLDKPVYAERKPYYEQR
ncbi:MAG: type IV secretory system conjugative DNA transfer family protein, partial [Oricola sp.]|nr:type IV secretory system conjugative DNA transfer family protein [Oricola sp.]